MNRLYELGLLDKENKDCQLTNCDKNYLYEKGLLDKCKCENK